MYQATARFAFGPPETTAAALWGIHTQDQRCRRRCGVGWIRWS